MRKSWLFALLRFLIGGGSPLLRDRSGTLANGVVEDLKSYLIPSRDRVVRTPRLHTYLLNWTPASLKEAYLLLLAFGFWMAKEFVLLVDSETEETNVPLDDALSDPKEYIYSQVKSPFFLSAGDPPAEAPSSGGASQGSAGPGPANPSPAGGESSGGAASSAKKQPAGADPTPAG